MKTKGKSAEIQLLTGLFFRLLPFQVLLIVINAVNGIVDSLYASNAIGKSAMSAIGLFGPFNHFLYAASMLFVSGSQMLYGRYLAKDREKIHGLFTVDLLISGGLGLLAALVLTAGAATGATRMFYRDPADPVYGMTVMGFRMMPLCMLPAMLSLQFACYAQTAEKKVMSIVLPIVDGMVGVVLFSLILIPAMGMNGLYLSNILNGVLCAAVILCGAWIHRKRCPRSFEDWMDIPLRIGAEADRRIDISVRGMEEVVGVSGQVIAFCRRLGLDERRAFFAGLCMEEMAGNVVTHGFTKDAKPHFADIRVVHKDNELILRIRDNCAGFDPVEYVRMMEQEDGAGRNVGIRLVYEIAEGIQYQNLLGMNVLAIRI